MTAQSRLPSRKLKNGCHLTKDVSYNHQREKEWLIIDPVETIRSRGRQKRNSYRSILYHLRVILRAASLESQSISTLQRTSYKRL